MTLITLASHFVIGWSIAGRPGPVSDEIIRQVAPEPVTAAGMLSFAIRFLLFA